MIKKSNARSLIFSFLPLYSILLLAVFFNATLWFVTHRIQPQWINVPPPPSSNSASLLGLGDTQLAYRIFSYQLQLMGNEGGDYKPLYQYDYNQLGNWFNVLDTLDSTSDYVPYLAAYYFGSTQKPELQLRPVIDYLAKVGARDAPGKWRWLVQAVYLAHYRYKNFDLALGLARDLSVLHQPDMPHWARQMPAILSAAAGDRETALALMRSILVSTIKEKGKYVDPVEVNFMVNFICRRLQTPDQAAHDPVCQK